MRNHRYTNLTGESRWIWLAIIVVSILFSIFLTQAIDGIGASLPSDNAAIPNAVRVMWPAIKGSPLLICFGAFFAFFNKFGWKCKWLAAAPDLNGTWSGHLIPGTNEALKVPVTMTIKQTWRDIMIVMETADTLSHSVMASVQYKGSDVTLMNVYVAERKPMAQIDMERHYGTNMMTVRWGKDRASIEGVYFTERDHGHHGAFVLS